MTAPLPRFLWMLGRSVEGTLVVRATQSANGAGPHQPVQIVLDRAQPLPLSALRAAATSSEVFALDPTVLLADGSRAFLALWVVTHSPQAALWLLPETLRPQVTIVADVGTVFVWILRAPYPEEAADGAPPAATFLTDLAHALDGIAVPVDTGIPLPRRDADLEIASVDGRTDALALWQWVGEALAPPATVVGAAPHEDAAPEAEAPETPSAVELAQDGERADVDRVEVCTSSAMECATDRVAAAAGEADVVAAPRRDQRSDVAADLRDGECPLMSAEAVIGALPAMDPGAPAPVDVPPPPPRSRHHVSLEDVPVSILRQARRALETHQYELPATVHDLVTAIAEAEGLAPDAALTLAVVTYALQTLDSGRVHTLLGVCLTQRTGEGLLGLTGDGQWRSLTEIEGSAR